VSCIASSSRLARTALALLALLLPSRLGSAQGSVTPLPPEDRTYGLSLGEWGAAWFQWSLSIPANVNPQGDTTGIRTGIGQRLPVWFLPTTSGSADVTRTILIPAGASILWAGPNNNLADAPGNHTEQQLRDTLQSANKASLDTLTVVDVSVDGVPVPDVLKRYRVQTPLFTAVLPPNNLAGFPVTAGKDQRLAMVVEGYYFMLSPLPVGKHVILTRLEFVDPANGQSGRQTLTYNLIILNPNDPIP